MKLKDAASCLGVSSRTVWNWAHRLGIQMRSHKSRCNQTIDMFSMKSGADESIEHDANVLKLLYQEKIKRKSKKIKERH